MKLVAPRLPTPLTAASGATAPALPTDVVAEQLNRMTPFCLMSGGSWSLAVLGELFLFPSAMCVCRMGLDYDFVKVLDFGLVTTQRGLSEAQTNTLLTAAGTLMGTPAYIAPEVIVDAGTGDARADVYALGGVANAAPLSSRFLALAALAPQALEGSRKPGHPRSGFGMACQRSAGNVAVTRMEIGAAAAATT